MLPLTFVVAGMRPSPEWISSRRMEPPDDLLRIRRVAQILDLSKDHTFDDLGKPIAGVGEAVEVVLALAAAVDDSPVPQQGQVVAHSRLAHVKLVAQSSDMPLPFGEQGDDLESGRVADLLEQSRCPLNGLCTQQVLVLSLGSLRPSSC